MTEPTLTENAKRLIGLVLERMRGPALVLLRKPTLPEPRADAQQVVKICSERGQTSAASPSPAARMLTLGTAGFQFSMGMDENDGALALPLESDHENFYSTGKISVPATQRVHNHGLAALLPFRWLQKVKALQGELWLGHAGAGVHVRINRDQFLLEFEAPAGTGRIDIGFGAELAAARVTDPVRETDAGLTSFKLWRLGVDAALDLAGSPNLATFPVDGVIGKIHTGSETTRIR